MEAIKRIWGISHIRAMIFCYNCNRHYELWRSLGALGGWTEQEHQHWQDIKDGKD